MVRLCKHELGFSHLPVDAVPPAHAGRIAIAARPCAEAQLAQQLQVALQRREAVLLVRRRRPVRRLIQQNRVFFGHRLRHAEGPVRAVDVLEVRRQPAAVVVLVIIVALVFVVGPGK